MYVCVVSVARIRYVFDSSLLTIVSGMDQADDDDVGDMDADTNDDRYPQDMKRCQHKQCTDHPIVPIVIRVWSHSWKKITV